MSEHSLDIKAFLGIDNTSDLASNRIKGKGIYLYECDNVDIDDEGKPHRRDGHESSIVTGTSIRSLWANDKICLFADGTNFKRLNVDDTVTTLIEQVNANDPFCYVEHGNIVYFSNNSIIGYIDVRTGLPYPFPAVTQSFKKKMIGGHILEWYNSRLFAANGANLFFSDATLPMQMDARKNVIAFPNRITMVKAVDDGLFVSDSKHVYFEYGKSPISEFIELKKSDIPAIEGMSVVYFGSVGKYGMNRIAYWMTASGPYAGYNGGVVVAKQSGLFSVEGLESGVAIVKSGDYDQLITIGKFKAGEGGSTGTFKVPTPTITSTSSTST